ncbi:MAG TPA: cytochrome c [Solirubrobacterales bacterium]|nr:cytochrome c [Solirubrobacterales bacterium]
MTDAKSPKVLFLIAILALAGAIAVAGCGGGSGTTAATEETTPAEESAPPAEKTEEAPTQEAGGMEALVEEGETVFTSTCGACHTLKAAGTTGEVGPDLDELEPDLATVEHQVINGGGPMPAFGKEGTLDPKEVKAVSTYVSSVAGSE